MIVAVEGIDGSGKTTLAKQLYGVLGGRARMVHFPSSRAAKMISALKSPRARSMVYAADFAEKMHIIGADHLILDRYVGSHYAYSPGVHGLDWMVFGLPMPDITFLCITDPYECFDRRNGAHTISQLVEWEYRFREFYRADSRCIILDDEESRLEVATAHIIKLARGDNP